MNVVCQYAMVNVIVIIHTLLFDSDMNMFLFLITIHIRLLFIQRDQKLIYDMYKTKLMLMGLRGENIKTATSKLYYYC